jgi:peroxiredoxin
MLIRVCKFKAANIVILTFKIQTQIREGKLIVAKWFHYILVQLVYYCGMILRWTLPFLIVIISMISCDNTTPKEIETYNADTMTIELNLEQVLAEKKANFEAKAPEDKKKIYGEGIDAVRNSGVIENAINVGDTAPNFTLSNAKGKPISLYNELKKGSVILMWYRGGWCPYCNLTLKYMQDLLPEFKKEGANLIALTPEMPDSSLSTKEKNNLQFEVLSDAGNKVAKAYGVLFKLTPEVAASYQKGFDLHSYNGDASDELPLAATYIIGKDRVVKYAFLDADYRNRAEPTTVLAKLKE